MVTFKKKEAGGGRVNIGAKFTSPRAIGVLDSLLWFVALPIALSLRLIDHEFAWSGYSHLALIALVTAFIQLSLGYYIGLYRGRYRFASFDELKGVVIVVLTASLFPILSILLTDSLAPRTIGFFATTIVLLGIFAIRFVLRSNFERRQRALEGTPTLIYGAGDVGSSLVQQMLRDRTHQYRPVGFIDDDKSKRRFEATGVKVLGTRAQLEEIVNAYTVQIVVVAITDADSNLLSELEEFSRERDIKLVVAPSASGLIDGKVRLSDLEDVTDEDLIGRRNIKVDEEAIRGLLTGKKILITGAGGSIGSELARQVHRYKPAKIFMLDRDDTLLHDLELSLDGKGLLTSSDLILADIRERARIREIFLELRPDIVFHAAALKHLSILELYPGEAEKTNVYGTKNVLDAALEAGVKVFVNVSTDKAVRPSSVLGRTKREAEKLTREAGESAKFDSRFVSVRFGNVLGSRGSVLGTFRHQIKKGGPLTLTDLKVKRYFMTIPEAVHLVLEASAVGENGDLMILDMGEQIEVSKIAQKLIDKSGKKIEIQVTGLRPGEKLYEELYEENERANVVGTDGIKSELE